MAAEDLNILIKAQIDQSQESIRGLNQQLDKLADKLKTLKVNVAIDDSQIKQFTANFTKATEKVKQKQREINKVFQDSQLSGEGYDELQKRIERVNKSAKEQAKVTVQTYKNTKNIKSAVIEYTDATGKAVKETMAWTEHLDKANNVKNKVFQTTGFTFIDNIEKERKETEQLTKSKIELRKKIVDLAQVGELSTKKLQELARATNKSENLDDIKNVNQLYEDALQTQRQLLDVEQKRANINKKESVRVANLGTVKESNLEEGLFETNKLKSYIASLYKVDEEYVDIKKHVNAAGKEVWKFHADIETGKDKFIRYEGNVDKATKSLYQFDNTLKKSLNRDLGVIEQLGVALKRIPVWMLGMSMFYFPIRQFQQGLEYITEIDKEMTNLKKVVDDNSVSFEQFGITANKIGNDLGKTTQDVIRATTEFARLGYQIKEATALAKESLLYSNVGDIDVQTSSQTLISTVKGFNLEVDKEGKNVRKIVDIFNEVGNNFAISSAGIGEALRRSSASLYESGNTLEQAVAMVTAANSSIQDPEKVGTALTFSAYI